MEISVIPPFLVTDGLLNEIQMFRGSLWGTVPAVTQGRNTHALDPHSWHVTIRLDSQLIACARYYRAAVVELGGFCVKRQGSRDSLRIIQAMIHLAKELGDSRFRAYASVTSGSASILQKLGGRLTGAPQYNPDYLDESVEIEFDSIPDGSSIIRSQRPSLD